MTTIHAATAPIIQYARAEAKPEGVSAPKANDKASAAELANLIATVLHGAEQAQAQQPASHHGGPVLRAPSRTESQAREALGGLEPRLREMLAKVIGTLEQTSTDPGAVARVSEGVASLLASAGPRSAERQAAADEPAAGNAEGVGARLNRWLVDNPMSQWLALFREVAIRLQAMEQNVGMQNLAMTHSMAVVAGQKGIEKANENLVGTALGAAVTGGIGAAGLGKSLQASNMQQRSVTNNLRPGNQVNVATARSSGMMNAHATPSAQLRPERSMGGTTLQADSAARTDPMRNVALSQPQQAEVADAHAAFTELNAKAQKPAAQAMMLNMLAQASGNTVAAGVGIAAEATEAEKLLAQNASETFQKIADSSKEQAGRTREVRQAAADVAQTLVRMQADTSSAIVRHM